MSLFTCIVHTYLFCWCTVWLKRKTKWQLLFIEVQTPTSLSFLAYYIQYKGALMSAFCISVTLPCSVLMLSNYCKLLLVQAPKSLPGVRERHLSCVSAPYDKAKVQTESVLSWAHRLIGCSFVRPSPLVGTLQMNRQHKWMVSLIFYVPKINVAATNQGNEPQQCKCHHNGQLLNKLCMAHTLTVRITRNILCYCHKYCRTLSAFKWNSPNSIFKTF